MKANAMYYAIGLAGLLLLLLLRMGLGLSWAWTLIWFGIIVLILFVCAVGITLWALSNTDFG